MKKYMSIFIFIFILIATILLGITKKHEQDSNLKTIKLAEVTHSVFYTPLYVAIEKDYFKEEGLNIDLILTPGADKVSAAVLSNDVNIGFAGAESTIYVFNGEEEDYLVSFAGLTKRDGQFIISRENKDFDLKNLYGKEILVGRKGGMPVLNFLNALKNNNIDTSKININYSIEFANLSGSFIGNMGDYVNLFEPNATTLVNQGYGYIVTSIGELSGEVPYTTFYARKSYIKENEEVIKKFNKALNKAIKFTWEKDNKTIAETIINQFPQTKVEDLELMIKNYKDYDCWLKNTNISEESFKNLENIMIDADLLNDYVNYNDLVKNYE